MDILVLMGQVVKEANRLVPSLIFNRILKIVFISLKIYLYLYEPLSHGNE